ncbi:MAG: hypothetical protein JWM80_395 [Cyanobacteria bacterium RYN_339]|nr:hypothetical protein [Cyanobacteria bacterium RYN_339]
MKARIVAFLGLGALVYGWACNPYLAPPPLPPPPLPTAAPNIAPVVGRTYVFNQDKGDLRFHVDALASDVVTYTMTAGGKATPGLTAKKTNGVYWVLPGPNPVTKDISTYPTSSVSCPAGTFDANLVTVDPTHLYWFTQGVVVQAQENNYTSNLRELLQDPR